MPITATVNYHITSLEQQAYHIDAGGVLGKIKAPELVPTQINIKDLRNSEASVEFTRDSIAFVQKQSAVHSFVPSNNWKEIYNQELNELLTQEIGAKEVIVFDHTIRTDKQSAERQPARNVHGDYNTQSAYQRLKEVLGEEIAEQWSAGHFGFINTWRPIDDSVNQTPLGFIHPRSVQTDDWLNIDLIYPDRKGQILGLVHNDSHEWFYLSKMTPDEIAIFNVYDNQGLPLIAHSALDLIEDATINRTRTSIESRVLVRY